MDELLEQIIGLKLKQLEKIIITSGVVTNITSNSCDVIRQDMPDLLEVRFHSIMKQLDNHITIIPKEGSIVLVALINNDITEAFIISTSEIDKVQIKIKKAEFIMDAGKFTLKNEFANLKQILNDVFKQLTQAIILTPAGPGSFSPNDIAVFTQQKVLLNKLFQ